MAEDKNTSQINMRIPGMKGGPRNRGAVVEKPVYKVPGTAADYQRHRRDVRPALYTLGHQTHDKRDYHQ